MTNLKLTKDMIIEYKIPRTPKKLNLPLLGKIYSTEEIDLVINSFINRINVYYESSKEINQWGVTEYVVRGGIKIKDESEMVTLTFSKYSLKTGYGSIYRNDELSLRPYDLTKPFDITEYIFHNFFIISSLNFIETE